MDVGEDLHALTGQGLRAAWNQRLWSSSPVPADWARAVRMQDLQDDITLCTWNDRTNTERIMRGTAPPMICIGVLLEGTLEMRPTHGLDVTVGPGTTLFHAAAHETAGQDTLRANTMLRLVDVRYAPQAFLPIVADSAVPVLRDALTCPASSRWAPPVLTHRPASPTARRIASEILACDEGTNPVQMLYLRAKALELLAVVLRDIGSTSTPRLPARDRKRVAMARHLLEDSYDEPWTTERLARRVGLSERKLQAGFREMIGTSVHAHLRAVRLAAAMAMLARGLSVTETAYAVGFSSLSHFSKAFRDHAGVTPRDWAKRSAGGCPEMVVT